MIILLPRRTRFRAALINTWNARRARRPPLLCRRAADDGTEFARAFAHTHFSASHLSDASHSHARAPHAFCTTPKTQKHTPQRGVARSAPHRTGGCSFCGWGAREFPAPHSVVCRVYGIVRNTRNSRQFSVRECVSCAHAARTQTTYMYVLYHISNI